jgi:hypothetical protein
VSTSAAQPFTGTVRLSTTQQIAAPVGRISPPVFTLAPGAHRAVTVSSTFPSASGDTAGSVTFATSVGRSTTVPDVLRSLSPITGGKGTFAGAITGGNGRGGAPAQTFTYAFDVPRGAPGLNVATTLARDEGDILEGVLIDPNGETPSIGTNYQVSQAPDQAKTDQSMSLSVANPVQGRWRFVLAALNPVSGEQLAMPFTGQVSLHSGVTVGTVSLPAAARTVLAAGAAHSATVTVTNTSPAPIYVQTDARTSKVQTVQLAPRALVGAPTSPTIQLPMSLFGGLATLPSFLVPPQTSSITATDSSDPATQVELKSVGAGLDWGGVDVVGDLKAAQHGSTVSTGTLTERNGYVGQGDWIEAATEVGPFGPDGEPSGEATLGLSATTPGFDPTVVSSTGDPYAESTDAAADPGKALAIAPGATATITLSITPTGKQGTTVAGQLNIVTPGFATLLERGFLAPVGTSGDVLATIPYTYTVGAQTAP